MTRAERAERLSRELRTETSPDLRRRRRIVSLSMIASASMGLIALYQTGVIKRLPDFSLPLMDAEKINGSAQAYERFSVPDAILGLGSYAATMGLAAMGGNDRARELPLIPLALAAKVAFDIANAAKLTVDQWTKHRAFCLWCLIAASATFAMGPLAIPEAKAAVRTLSGKNPAT